MSPANPAGGSTEPVRFSFSRLQSYANCPAQYRYRYIDRLPEQGLSIEAYLGRRLHEVLEWLYQPDRSAAQPSFDALLARFRESWAAAWQPDIMIARPAWHTDDYYQLGQRALAGFYRRHEPFDAPVTHVERSFALPLEGLQNVEISGVMDRTDRLAEGHWAIHDYKSGRRMISEAKAGSDLQMRIYFWALQQLETGIEQVDIVWHFLQHGRSVTLPSVDWQIARIAAQLRRKVEPLLAVEDRAGALEPKESPLCGWCHYWAACPAKRGQTHPARVAQ